MKQRCPSCGRKRKPSHEKRAMMPLVAGGKFNKYNPKCLTYKSYMRNLKNKEGGVIL